MPYPLGRGTRHTTAGPKNLSQLRHRRCICHFQCLLLTLKPTAVIESNDHGGWLKANTNNHSLTHSFMCLQLLVEILTLSGEPYSTQAQVATCRHATWNRIRSFIITKRPHLNIYKTRLNLSLSLLTKIEEPSEVDHLRTGVTQTLPISKQNQSIHFFQFVVSVAEWRASYEIVGESEFECGLPNLPGHRGWLGEQG